jgi:predicted Zn-dependent protease
MQPSGFILYIGMCIGLLALSAWGQAPPAQMETVERAVRDQPDSEASRIALAALYLQIGRNRNAADTLQEYLKAHKGSVAVLKLLATAHLRQEDYASAKAAASQVAPSDAAALHLLGMAELGLQNGAAGEKLLRASLKLDPEAPETNFQLGLLYTKQRDHLSEAIILLRKALAKEPGSGPIQTALGSAYLESEKPEEAARYLESATKIAPESVEPWYLLAEAYRRLHQDAQADGALRQFNDLSKVAADQRAREMRSRSLYEEGLHILTTSEDPVQLDRAAWLFKKVIQELPGFDAGYYRLAQIDYMKGDLTEALASIREALKLNTLEPEYYYVQAKCLEAADGPAALRSIR